MLIHRPNILINKIKISFLSTHSFLKYTHAYIATNIRSSIMMLVTFLVTCIHTIVDQWNHTLYMQYMLQHAKNICMHVCIDVQHAGRIH